MTHPAVLKLLNYSRQVCLGMTYLSVKGFVHRDIAARNILVSGDGICKVCSKDTSTIIRTVLWPPVSKVDRFCYDVCK